MNVTVSEYVPLPEIDGSAVLKVLSAAHKRFGGQELRFMGTLGGAQYENATFVVIGDTSVMFLAENGRTALFSFNDEGAYKAGRWSPSRAQAVELLRWLEAKLAA